jgi:hypothetical protein
LLCVLLGAIVLSAQTPAAPGPPANIETLKNFLPLAPPATLAPSQPADLSGTWLRSGGLQNVSLADVGGNLRGNEPDIPYQPWARQKTLSEVPPTGPFGQPDKTTDPWIRYCESNGPFRIFMHPGRFNFVQLPDKVLILHEVMQQFRLVRLNSTHPPFDDLDPTWWGDSIGWYENGNTLVVDTIGTNGRTWLSQQGQPTTVKLHVIERYRRMDPATVIVDVTIDDPGAYTKPFATRVTLRQSTVPFMQSPWNCSVRDNTNFNENLLRDAVGTSPRTP